MRLNRYRVVTDRQADGQTDGRTDRITIASTRSALRAVARHDDIVRDVRGIRVFIARSYRPSETGVMQDARRRI